MKKDPVKNIKDMTNMLFIIVLAAIFLIFFLDADRTSTIIVSMLFLYIFMSAVCKAFEHQKQRILELEERLDNLTRPTIPG
jgi:L-asparagine transporter-like permease